MIMDGRFPHKLQKYKILHCCFLPYTCGLELFLDWFTWPHLVSSMRIRLSTTIEVRIVLYAHCIQYSLKWVYQKLMSYCLKRSFSSLSLLNHSFSCISRSVCGLFSWGLCIRQNALRAARVFDNKSTLNYKVACTVFSGRMSSDLCIESEVQ